MAKNTTAEDSAPGLTPEAQAALDKATSKAAEAAAEKIAPVVRKDAKSVPDKTGITAAPVVKLAGGFKVRNH